MTNEPLPAEGYLGGPEMPSNGRVVPVRIGDGLHGVPAEKAGDMVILSAITPVAFAPRQVRGVVNQHGRMATVIETRVALGLDPAPSPILVGLTVEEGGHLYVLAVDEVKEVVDPLSAGHPIAPLDIGAIVAPA